MFQFITQQNILFYAMAVVCAWGVISQVVLHSLYGRLLKDASRPGTPKGKFMRQLRQRYQSSRRMKQNSMNVSAFIRKNLMEYRFLGASLHGWKRMGGTAMVLTAALGAVGWYLTQPQTLTMNIQQNYIFSAVAAELMIVLAYGLMDNGFAGNRLEVVLQDSLENSLALHASGALQFAPMQQENEEFFAKESSGVVKGASEKEAEMGNAEKGMTGRETAAEEAAMKEAAVKEAAAGAEKSAKTGKMVSLPGRKKKNGKDSGTQKDKRELKQNLSKLKEGIRETAASSESRKEQNAKILREMDPDEQERIIREVLKEFLP